MQDVCKVGDVIKVKVTKVDDKGKVNVSRKALLPKPVKKEEKTEKNDFSWNKPPAEQNLKT